MKKIITWILILGVLVFVYKIVFAANKNVIYINGTKEIIGVVAPGGITNAKNAERIDIKCENGRKMYGVNTKEISIISIDEQNIPENIADNLYKIDILTKDIYEPITIEYISGYKIKNIKKEIIGRLTYSSGTTYNIYNMKGTKLGTYKASVKLTTTNIKGKEYKLIKVGTSYTIKE